MKAKKSLGGIEGNIGNENNNIYLVMASNTPVTQDHNINNYELCVDSNDTSKKGEFKKPNIDIKFTQKKIGGTTVMNAMNGKGGDSETITNPNRIEC
jgi:hypothetical protein